MTDLKKVGMYIAKLLRHNPEDLKIDSEGYVIVSELLNKIKISEQELDFIVINNDKKRFAYNSDKTKIRASQGHSNSLDINIKMIEADRIDYLYHGTAYSNLESIMKNGLVSKNRKHVHLSKDVETAKKVGLRHSKDIIILKINSAKMRADSIKIWISDNGVYLTNIVDSKYISIC